MNNIFKRIMLVLAGVSILSSCGQDEIAPTEVHGNTDNIVYFNLGQTMVSQQINTYSAGTISVSYTGTESEMTPFAIASHPDSLCFFLHCTRLAPEDIIVKFEKEEAPEGFSALPGSVSALNKMEFTIPKGEVRSIEPVVLFMSEDDILTFTEVGNYTYPFKISSVSGGANLSSTMSAGVYNFNFSFVSNARAATPVGTVVNPKPTGEEAWTVTATKDGGTPPTITNPDRMLDDNTATNSYASTGNVSAALPFTLDFDLKQEYTGINGFRIVTSANNYRLTRANVYVKKSEADPWVLHGPVTFANNSNHYVSFYGPVDARFIRCEITAVQNANNGLRIIDFNIYR